MKENTNENIKTAEDESIGIESKNDILKNVIGGNLIKEDIIIERFESVDSKIGESIPKAYGEDSNPNKEEDIRKREEILERARKIVKEYDDTVGKITNNKGDTVEEEIISSDIESNKGLSSEEIESAIEDYLNGKNGVSEKEKEDFGDFIKKKINAPITRRNVLKILAGAAIALISKDFLLDNINAWWAEYLEQKENDYEIEYSKEMTKLYEELEKFPEQEINYEKVNKNLDGIGIEFEHAKFIKDSEKKEVDEMIDSMITNKNDVILFGEYHGVDSNAINAKQVLEKLMDKTNKKISQIGLEFLDFSNPESVESIKKFNNKQISPEDFYSKGYFLSDIRPLLEFAQKNNIPIEGLEDKNNLGDDLSLEEKAAKRAVDMNLKVGSMAQEKDSNDILVIFSGMAHSSKSGYGEKKGRNYLSPVKTVEYTTQGTADEAVENNYLFKESLEKQKFKPAVIKLEDMNHQAQANNNLFSYTYNFLKENNAQEYSDQWKKEWEYYKIKRKNPFSINSTNEDNSYLLVSPDVVPDTPPALSVFEEVRKNFHPLHEMVRKIDYVSYSPYKYEMNLLSQTGSSISAKLADISLESGKPKKLFLPKQLKNNHSGGGKQLQERI